MDEKEWADTVNHLNGMFPESTVTLALYEGAQARMSEAALRKQKDAAYAERNQCVALLARMAIARGWKAGVREHPAEDTAWDADWRTIVFIDLPTGQASWHFHDSEKHLLGGLPRYVGEWDGHTTEEKYRRVAEVLP